MAQPSVFKISDFSTLFLTRVLSTMSLQAQAVIVGWHVYELSHDPLMLGLIGLAEAVPAIGFAFLSGHVVDSKRPVAIYQISLLVLVLNSALILLTSLPQLPINAGLRLGTLFVAVFISGMVRSFTGPSVFALISHVVPRPRLAQASAWNSWAFQMAAIFGPALGGLIYGAFGATVAFTFPLVMMTAAWIAGYSFTSDTAAMRNMAKREPFIASVRTGIRFAARQKVLLSSMILDMFSVLFGGAVAILPMFSDQVLHAGSMGLGLLRAGPSIGSGLIALYLSFRPMQTISGRTLLIVVAGFGLSIIGFGLSTQFLGAMLFLIASGIFDGVSMVIRNTILQLLTPSEMRGRISSLSLIFITSSNEIGAFESGLAARAFGLIPSILFGGVMTLMTVGITTWASPDLRKARIRPDFDPKTTP